jgi:hypothetical protein
VNTRSKSPQLGPARRIQQEPAASPAAGAGRESSEQVISDSPRQLDQSSRLAQLRSRSPGATPSGAARALPSTDSLPDGLRTGIEALSGMDMSAIRVHRNSSRPKQLAAHAYAQGTDIHLGPGQDKHLPHEAWHVVQQMQGRVRPTLQMPGGPALNTDRSLESEADAMGSKAVRQGPRPGKAASTVGKAPAQAMVQRVKGIRPDTHVEVNDGGPTWYGQVVSVDGDNYTIRVGGMETETTVHERHVDFHPVHRAINKQGVENFLYDKDGRIQKGMSPKEEQQRLNIAKNPGQTSSVGKYVFHSTSYQNLPSILSNGIDPAKGGGPGGSCELCEEGQLKQTSIENSKNKIAVAVDRLTMGTYINQREDFASKPEQGDSARHFSVLLRFKVQERHQGFKNPKKTISSTWSKDPDDKRAWHLSNTPVLPSEIEFLSHDGWHPLVDIKNLDQMLDEQILASPMSVSQMPKGEFQRDYPGLDLVF